MTVGLMLSIIMYNMDLRILIIALLVSLIHSDLQPRQLEQQINTTMELIQLHTKKLELLQQLYHQRFPYLPPPNYKVQSFAAVSTNEIQRTHPKLLMLAKYETKTRLFPPQYILTGNRILKINGEIQTTDFIGEVLIIQTNKLTTLIGGKVSMSELKQQAGAVKKEEYFLGLDADHTDSLWHRNLNIKDGEDLLVQWKDNVIAFRGKEVRKLRLQDSQTVLALYSVNQYKLVFVSTLRVGTLNSRSLQLGQHEWARNISRFPNSTIPLICSSYQQDNMIYLLLNTGEIAKYFNDKVIATQRLPEMEHSYGLAPHTDGLYYVHPFFFLAKQNYSLFRVYNAQHSKLEFITEIALPHKAQPQNRYYAFFKQNQSYRLLYSTESESYLYQLLLPTGEDAIQGFGIYFKVLGIISVIGFFIYFRMHNKKEENHERTGDPRRKTEGEKNKQKATTSEIEEFLRFKELKQGKQKHA